MPNYTASNGQQTMLSIDLTAKGGIFQEPQGSKCELSAQFEVLDTENSLSHNREEMKFPFPKGEHQIKVLLPLVQQSKVDPRHIKKLEIRVDLRVYCYIPIPEGYDNVELEDLNNRE